MVECAEDHSSKDRGKRYQPGPFYLLQTTKTLHRLLHTAPCCHFLCKLISQQYGVYIPKVLNEKEAWKTRLREMYAMRNIWQAKTDLITSHAFLVNGNNPSHQKMGHIEGINMKKFKINVYAKFRPLVSSTDSSMQTFKALMSHHDDSPQLIDNQSIDEGSYDQNKEESVNESIEVTLPLHQRLAMIKMSHNIKSNRQALKILATEGGWFAAKWNTLASNQKSAKDQDMSLLDIENRNESNIRYNPVMNGKKAEKLMAKVQTIDSLKGKVVVVAPDVGLREFSYDGVFSPTSSQQSTYDKTTHNLVCDLINGSNATILVYGQTSSGKTYTMFGPDNINYEIFSASENMRLEEVGAGIVARACTEIFEAINKRRRINNIEAEVSISYVEVFGDRISDLLRNGERCGQSKAAGHQYVLQGSAERPVRTLHDVKQALIVGDACKRRAATAMNERSTRAHNIFILSLKQTSLNTGISYTSKLFLADLGGSEQVKKSQVNENPSKDNNPQAANQTTGLGFQLGDRMRETVYINLGLLALKKCIDALNTGSNYIPYQDSKLTMLLSSGLGGNSKTSIIVCSRLEAAHIPETVATLRFGEKCSLIENKLSSEDSMLQDILKSLDKQIKDLEAIIMEKERWELVEYRRRDCLAESGTIEKATGGIEVRTVTRLVGAEKERKELDKLLNRRAQFIGINPIDEDEASSTAKMRKKPLGFGGELAETYGIGSEYKMEEEERTMNERFLDQVEKSHVPSRVRKGWVAGEQIAEDPAKLEQKALKIKRNKLKFAGISI